MSPKKQPSSLFSLCVRKSICLINSACCFLDKEYYQNGLLAKCEREATALDRFLKATLPARLFDVLCSERKSQQYSGEPRFQLMMLTHPKMTVFRKSDVDNSVAHEFWLETICNFNLLRVLDLKFLCSDEILKVISASCPLLEEVNIVSRVDICKSLFNASVLIRNVSDEGLLYVAKLNRLKVITMDPPRHKRVHKIGRCVSQSGIISLMCQLPQLQELKIDTCDIGTTLISSKMEIDTLSLQKINCHYASGAGIKKLLKICPHLKELSVTHLSENDKDAIMNEITMSDANLTRLDLSFFTFTHAVHEMLAVKGRFLTHFSLWEIELSLTFDSILCIGSLCPNLNTLCIGTQSTALVIPLFFTKEQQIFTKLQTLTLGNGNFCLESLLSFFVHCTDNLQTLVLKYQIKKNIDRSLLRLLRKGCFTNITYLWFDCTLEVSKDVAMEIINMCEYLQTFTMDFGNNMSDFQKHIVDNNLDLKIDSSWEKLEMPPTPHFLHNTFVNQYFHEAW